MRQILEPRMRAHASTAVMDQSALGLVRLMDDFAALKSLEPTIGGYRVLRPRPFPRTTSQSTVAMLARARMRLTGFLVVLFVGGLGLAVLSGPASCPCDGTLSLAERTPTASGRVIVARLAYAKNAAIVADRAHPLAGEPFAAGDSGELTMLATAAAVEPSEAIDASPISTSAIGPVDALPAHDASALPQRIGGLPTKIEELSDTAPKPIGLAAAPLDDDAPAAMLLVVEVAAPAMPDVVAVDADPEPPVEIRAVRRHLTPRNRDLGARAARVRGARYTSAAEQLRIKRAAIPSWARKMYETPWQTKAFSYD
jgi:hypothetical protein